MSLVNDMLRDLDQRRKESEGPAARIRLTPAGDYPRQERKNWIPHVGLGLIILASGLGYVWVNMNGTESSMQISRTIAPDTAIVVDAVEEAPLETDVIAVAPPSATTVETVPDISIASPLDAVLTGEELQDQLHALAALSAREVNSTPVVIQNPQPAGTIGSSGNSSLAATPVSRAPPASVRRPELTNIAPEQVKDVTEPSPEQKDTIVVQEALRLIANNQPTAAYTNLEKHLLDNPYAHQSRETYAKFLMNQGDISSARSLIEAGLELAPNHSGFKKVKARLLIDGGDIQSAVSLLESRAPTVSNDLEYHEILASAQLASRDFDGAALSYTGLVQQDQTQGRWWYGFAAAQDALGNLTAAKQAYSRALEKPNLSTNLRRRSQDRLTALSQ